jgi:acetyl-CoA C-acetyltransferase
MIDIVIAGVGQTPVGEHWGISLRDLAMEAVSKAQMDANGLIPEAIYVGNMLGPVLSHQAHTATLIADYVGLQGIEAVTIEASGASGGAALRMGYLAIASGLVSSCLVVGVEKMTDQTGPGVEAAIATALDSDYEAAQGLTPTAQAAMLMNRYLHTYQAPRSAFGRFPIQAHANAASNPNAMYRNRVKESSYEQAGMVSSPLNIFDIAPAADGAAALVLARRDLLPMQVGNKLVRITGSSIVTDALAIHDRHDPLEFKAVRLSIERACRQSGMLPHDVDLFELHDAYSIYAVQTLEAAGFAERGRGWELALNGEISLTGKIPISTFGGMKARGNPGGAAGIYQAVEAVLQLRGEAKLNQVPEARRAMIQNLGGAGATAVVHIFEAVPEAF